VKYGDTTVRASDRILHNRLFFHIQRSLLMGDVFVAMLAYRKFSPNCAWRAMLVNKMFLRSEDGVICPTPLMPSLG
jgi:hypothetical protein